MSDPTPPWKRKPLKQLPAVMDDWSASAIDTAATIIKLLQFTPYVSFDHEKMSEIGHKVIDHLDRHRAIHVVTSPKKNGDLTLSVALRRAKKK